MFIPSPDLCGCCIERDSIWGSLLLCLRRCRCVSSSLSKLGLFKLNRRLKLDIHNVTSQFTCDYGLKPNLGAALALQVSIRRLLLSQKVSY